MTRIVSLTPIAVQRDSRTFKQSASVARFGYESVLVEGEPSSLDRSRLPFALRTTGPGGSRWTRHRAWRVARWLGLKVRGVLFLLWPRAVDLLVVLWRSLPGTLPWVPAASLYYLHSPLHYPAVRLRTRGRIPFVYDAHDFYAALLSDNLPARLLLWLEARCMRDAAEVVTVGEGCAALMESRFGRRPQVIHNLHDPRMDESLNSDLRAELGLGGEDFLLVMAGNAKSGTAFHEAIRAMSELPSHVHLAFVGRGWGDYASAVRARRLSRRVHLCPAVPPTGVVPFIASADAAIILYHAVSVSHRHALPNGLFLAISAELPVLYPTELVDLRALMEEHRLGLPIDPLDPGSLVEAVTRLLNHPAVLDDLRESTRRVRELLSWEHEEGRLKAIIETALRRSSERQGPRTARDAIR